MTRRNRFLAIVWVLVCTAPAGGCVPLAVGGGAVAVNAESQERGLEGTINDTVIRANINEHWYSHDKAVYNAVGLQVTEGRVLLTGRAPTQQVRLDAVRLAWQVDGVKEVINEIQIAKEGEGSTFGTDTWITTQLNTKLLFDRDVESVNYSVEAVRGVVYLMGIAQTQAELDRVTNHARNLRYVRRVVSYVRIKDDPGRQGT